AAVVFPARGSGDHQEIAGRCVARDASVLSLRAKAPARAAERSTYLRAPGSLSSGYVPHRDALPIWFLAKSAPRRVAYRSAGLSLRRAIAGLPRNFTGVARSARKSEQRWRPRLVRTARLCSHRQRPLRALESVGPNRNADGA